MDSGESRILFSRDFSSQTKCHLVCVTLIPFSLREVCAAWNILVPLASFVLTHGLFFPPVAFYIRCWPEISGLDFRGEM